MANPTVRVRGRRISLNDLPMTVFATSCGHGGKDRAIVKGDWVQCEECQDQVRVTKILASRGEVPVTSRRR